MAEETKAVGSQEGIEAVFQAAEAGDIGRLQYLIEYTAVNLCERDSAYRSALHRAIRSGSLEVVRYLVERVGLSPLAGDRSGVTPYDLAHRLGDEGILAYFEEVCGFSWRESYHNPVRRGFYPDPSVIRVGDDFYMVNSSFCFFPCIPVSHSRDLIHWQVIGYAIARPEYAKLDGLDGGRGYWAPDISFSGGRFYVTATLRLNEGMGEKRVQIVTSSSRPEGPYDEPSWIHEDGIDPSIFHDSDGRKYMLLNRGARILELSRDCRRQISPARLLWYGDWKRTPEGPHLLRRGNYYYLFMAEGGTGSGHRITVARAAELMGPYEPCPYNPILIQRDERALLQCCGHGKPVELGDGSWCILYLCARRSEEGWAVLGRETALDPMEWTADGWPLINRGRGPSVQQRRPAGTWEPENERQPEGGYPFWMGRAWMTPRALSRERILCREGKLRLLGQAEDLCSVRCSSVLVERQSEFRFEAVCELLVPELAEGESFGVTCYYDENSYIKYGIGVQDEAYGILLQEYVGDGYRSSRFDRILTEDGLTGRTLELRIETDGLSRTFSWNLGEGWEVTGTLKDTRYLSSEGLVKGKRFTGATLGMYVHGPFWGTFTRWDSKYME